MHRADPNQTLEQFPTDVQVNEFSQTLQNISPQRESGLEEQLPEQTFEPTINQADEDNAITVNPTIILEEVDDTSPVSSADVEEVPNFRSDESQAKTETSIEAQSNPQPESLSEALLDTHPEVQLESEMDEIPPSTQFESKLEIQPESVTQSESQPEEAHLETTSDPNIQTQAEGTPEFAPASEILSGGIVISSVNETPLVLQAQEQVVDETQALKELSREETTSEVVVITPRVDVVENPHPLVLEIEQTEIFSPSGTQTENVDHHTRDLPAEILVPLVEFDPILVQETCILEAQLEPIPEPKEIEKPVLHPQQQNRNLLKTNSNSTKDLNTDRPQNDNSSYSWLIYGGVGLALVAAGVFAFKRMKH